MCHCWQNVVGQGLSRLGGTNSNLLFLGLMRLRIILVSLVDSAHNRCRIASQAMCMSGTPQLGWTGWSCLLFLCGSTRICLFVCMIAKERKPLEFINSRKF